MLDRRNLHLFPVLGHRAAGDLDVPLGQFPDDFLVAERVGGILGLTPLEVEEVATFYDKIFRRPVGKKVIHICDSVCCWTRGSEETSRELEKQLGIKPGETTQDGVFTLLPTCCLGMCGKAPAMTVGPRAYEKVVPEEVAALVIEPVIAPSRKTGFSESTFLPNRYPIATGSEVTTTPARNRLMPVSTSVSMMPAVYRRVIRSSSAIESVDGSHTTPPLAPPNGTFTIAHFQVIREASAITSPWETVLDGDGHHARDDLVDAHGHGLQILAADLHTQRPEHAPQCVFQKQSAG